MKMTLRDTKTPISLLSIIVGIILIISPPAILSFSESVVAALVIIVITFWVTGIIPEYLTAILLFVVVMLFSIVPANIIFSGFTSAAFWLVFAGLVIGVGINGTGFGERVAGKVATHLNGSYFKLISGLVFIGLIFAFLMPSGMGRVVLLVPIALSISNCFGFKKGSNGFIGVILAVVLGSVIPGFSILPANVPNMILAGMTESLYQYSPLYGEYLLLHFPVLGFLKAVTITALILWMYPDKPVMGKTKLLKTPDAMSKNERILAVVLVILIAFWITDFIHHISPAWIALSGAVFLLLPKVGIVSNQQFRENMNFGSLFFIAGILGLGSMINYSGLGNSLAQHLISYLPLNLETPFINYMSLSISSMLTGIVTTMPGVPAVLTPLSNDLAQASGLPLKSVFMTQVVGFSTTIFPYQAPPILIGMQLAQVKLIEALKVCLYLAVISVFLLLPLNYIWWQLLEWI
jgi:di/tricarboxylate transporter